MTNSISRRNFLKGSVATAAVASLAACGGSDGGDATDGSKKKIVRWGQGNPKLGLDMQKSTNSGSSNVSDPIFESLLRWTEENELVPCLLTRAHAVAQQKIVPLARAEACAIVAGDIGTAQSRRAEAELGGVLVRLGLCLRGLGKSLQKPG